MAKWPSCTWECGRSFARAGLVPSPRKRGEGDKGSAEALRSLQPPRQLKHDWLPACAGMTLRGGARVPERLSVERRNAAAHPPRHSRGGGNPGHRAGGDRRSCAKAGAAEDVQEAR
jgi:hypothetical protein